MKLLLKLLFICFLFVGTSVSAEPFKVLVLPLDLFSVGENYYCFPEASEIFANDLIMELNKTNKIISPDLYEVRRKFNDNPQLKQTAVYAFNRYGHDEKIDFYALKKLAQAFNAKSVILISSFVIQENSKRKVWEVLEVSTAFDILNQYHLKTSIVLTDNVNNVVMWSGKYDRILGDNEYRFWAKSFSAAITNLEKLKMYSKDILIPSVKESIVLRFYPKVMKPVNTQKNNPKTQTSDFRPNPLETHSINNMLFKEGSNNNADSETIYSF